MSKLTSIGLLQHQLPEPNYFFHGLGARGGARVVQKTAEPSSSTTKFIGRGRVSRLYKPFPGSDSLRDPLWILIHTTPGYEAAAPDDVRIECLGLDGETYLLVGTVYPNKSSQGAAPRHAPLAAGTKLVHSNHSTSTSSQVVADLELQRKKTPEPSTGTKRRSHNNVNSDVKAELELIWAARQAGSDPQVKMRHVAAILLLSPQTVYRKIQKQEFSPPLKRGRGSYWRMSQLDAYLANK